MEPICVALSSQSHGLFWDAVIQSLKSEPGIELCRVGDDDRLQQFLQRTESQLLIIEHNGSSSFSNTGYQHYSQINHRLAVIAIDASGLDTFIKLKDLGRELLVKLVRAILSEKPIESSSQKLTLLRASDVLKLVPTSNSFSKKNNGMDHTQAHLCSIQAWLDVCLHQCLLEECASDGNDISIPGWAMSAKRARAILGGDYAQASATQLQKVRRDMELKLAEYESPNSAVSTSRLTDLNCAFRLNELEKKIFYFALSPELDGRYARVFGFLNDDFSRCRPTPTLLSKLVAADKQSVWDVYTLINTGSALASFRLLIEEPNDTHPVSETGLKVAPELIDYLISASEKLDKDGGCLQLKKSNSCQNTTVHTVADHKLIKLKDADENIVEEKIVEEKFSRWRGHLTEGESLPLMQLIGDASTLNWFCRVCDDLGEAIVLFNTSTLPNFDWQTVNESLFGAIRLALIHRAFVIVTGVAELPAVEQKRIEGVVIAIVKQRLSRIVLHRSNPHIFSDLPEVWQVERSMPSFKKLKRLWRNSALSFDIRLSEKDLSILATTVRLDSPEINAVLGRLIRDGENICAARIIETAQSFRQQTIPSSVRRLRATFKWGDIVLPDPVLCLLQEIPNHVRDSGTVLEEWGYRTRMPYGRGITALFSGPSGTGKTMAAQIIASELGVELFQVDLAKTISKYIGETEKNLDNVFEAAEQAGAVLLFDEADALFGKRTEVRDAHDRYANVEVAFLLQRMEIFSGLAILTTNFRQNLDKAFMRRLRFVVNFSMPVAAEREAIWQSSFPKDAPLGSDVCFKMLARRLDLSGGNIQQIAIRSAFRAAAEDRTISMKHIVRATCDELRKLGMGNEEKTLADLVLGARCA